MFKIILILFLVYSNIAFCLSGKTKRAIDQVGIKTNDLVFIMDQSECTSCLNVDLLKALKFYENHPRNVYFLNESKQGKEKMEIILFASGFNVNTNQVVFNADLYSFLKKKHLVKFNGEKFEEKFDLDKNPQTNLKVTVSDSVALPNRKASIPYDLLELDGVNYFLSQDLGQITYLDQGKLEQINLYDRIDTFALLNRLRLDSTDFKLTLMYIKDRNLIGDRFVEFKSFCPATDGKNFYLSMIVSNKHLYTLQEKKDLMDKSDLAKKTFSKDINIDVTCFVTKVLIIKINKNWEIKEYLWFSDPPQDYLVHIHSPFYIHNNDVYANTFYFPEKFNSTFVQKNYILENFKRVEDSLFHSGFSSKFKSIWYNQIERYSNFTETSFQKINGKVFLKTNSIPHWFNVTDEIIFEVPLDELDKAAKNEKNKNSKINLPSFSNLGILQLSQTEYIGFFRSPITALVYYARFNEKGQFNSLEKLEIDISYNGIIQVLNNRLVRTKEKHMLIYDLN